MCVGKLLCAFSDEIDVRALFEDEAGGLNGIAEPFDTGHAPGSHAATVHEQGVELHAGIGGEKATAAGVKGGIVFEDDDRGFDSVKGRAATREDGLTGFKGGANAGLVGFGSVGGNGPCAAVNEEGGREGLRVGHRNMVVQRAPAAMGWNGAACCFGKTCQRFSKESAAQVTENIR